VNTIHHAPSALADQVQITSGSTTSIEKSFHRPYDSIALPAMDPP